MSKEWKDYSEFLVNGMKKVAEDIIRIDSRIDKFLLLCLACLLSLLGGIIIFLLKRGGG